MKQRSIISIANEQVDIRLVCQLIGVNLPDIPEGKSVKVHCPFAHVYHKDQGVQTSFRVYPHSNSAYCFDSACSEYFSPVSLAAKAWDKTWEDAAVELLDRIGYKPVSIAQAWEKVATHTIKPDTTNLAQALQTYCSRLDSRWEDRQFIPEIAAVLDRCFALLSRVHTEDDARQWLDTAKLVMQRALQGQVAK